MREHTNIRESGGFIQEREGRSCKDRGEGAAAGGRRVKGEWVWLFLSVGDPLPFFEVEVPPRRHGVPVEESLPLKQSAKCEDLRLPPLQLATHQII